LWLRVAAHEAIGHSSACAEHGVIEKLMEGQERARQQLEQQTMAVVSRMEAVLGRHAVEQGGVSPDFIKSLFNGAMEELRGVVAGSAQQTTAA